MTVFVNRNVAVKLACYASICLNYQFDHIRMYYHHLIVDKAIDLHTQRAIKDGVSREEGKVRNYLDAYGFTRKLT